MQDQQVPEAAIIINAVDAILVEDCLNPLPMIVASEVVIDSLPNAVTVAMETQVVGNEIVKMFFSFFVQLGCWALCSSYGLRIEFTHALPVFRQFEIG